MPIGLLTSTYGLTKHHLMTTIPAKKDTAATDTPAHAQAPIAQSKGSREAYTQFLLLPHSSSRSFLQEMKPGLASKQFCQDINNKKVLKGDDLKNNLDLETLFQGHQKINQVLRWISSATLVVNETLDLNGKKPPIERKTPEVQASVLPSREIVLGSNAIDTNKMPELLRQLINNKNTFNTVTEKIEANIASNQLRVKDRPKDGQRLRHIQSLNKFVNDDAWAKKFINAAISECSSEFDKIVTRNYLNDIRQAMKSEGEIKMVAAPNGLEHAHAEQRIFEYIRRQKWQPIGHSTSAWQLNQAERNVMKGQTLLPVFIAGTKPPCSSCSNLETERSEYAYKNGTSAHFYAVRAEDRIISKNGISPAVGELFVNTHTTRKLLEKSEETLPDTTPNKNGFIRRDSVIAPALRSFKRHSAPGDSESNS